MELRYPKKKLNNPKLTDHNYNRRTINQVNGIIFLYSHINYEVNFLALSDNFSRIKTEKNSSILIISIAKNSTVILDQQEVELKEQHAVFYYSQGADLYLIAQEKDAKVFILTFKTGFLQHSEIELDHQQKIEQSFRSSSILRTFNAPSLYSTAMDLINSQFPDALIPTFYKSKSLNIFCRLVAYLELLSEPGNTRLRVIDIEKIKVAKELIESNLNQNFTIPQLARTVGTNEQYLKKHFKQFYGKTVFNFIVECKMHKAKQMIKERNLKISAISQQLGYKHATHFTTAFKKFFGYTPNALRYLFVVFIENYAATKDIASILI